MTATRYALTRVGVNTWTRHITRGLIEKPRLAHTSHLAPRNQTVRVFTTLFFACHGTFLTGRRIVPTAVANTFPRRSTYTMTVTPDTSTVAAQIERLTIKGGGFGHAYLIASSSAGGNISGPNTFGNAFGTVLCVAFITETACVGTYGTTLTVPYIIILDGFSTIAAITYFTVGTFPYGFADAFGTCPEAIMLTRLCDV